MEQILTLSRFQFNFVYFCELLLGRRIEVQYWYSSQSFSSSKTDLFSGKNIKVSSVFMLKSKKRREFVLLLDAFILYLTKNKNSSCLHYSLGITVHQSPPSSIHLQPAPPASIHLHPAPSTSTQLILTSTSSIHFQPAHFTLHPTLCNTLNNIWTKILHVTGQFPQI